LNRFPCGVKHNFNNGVIFTEDRNKYDWNCTNCELKESIKAGKFVIAPALDHDYDGLAKDCTLSEGIKFYKNLENPNQYIESKQKFLNKKYSREIIETTLVTAIELSQAEEINDINFFSDEEDFYFL